MSKALWCDVGNHAFSEKDPDKEHYTKTAKKKLMTGNSYGSPVYQEQEQATEEIDICGPCVAKQGLFQDQTDKVLER